MKNTSYLILRAQRGDQQALNQLFSNWYDRVFNTAYRYCSDTQLAKEITQQTFLIVQEKLGQLLDPESFKVWLYRITINQCHGEVRKATTRDSHQYRFSDAARNNVSESPERIYERTERSELVLKAIQQLPEEQRVVVIMKEYEGLKFREIAEALDISENTAKSRMYYGLKALRKSLVIQNFISGNW